MNFYKGDICECTYAGLAGNIQGVDHYKIIEEGVPLLKIGDHNYIRLEDYMSEKKVMLLKDYGINKGDHFVQELKPLSQDECEIIYNNIRQRRKAH